MLAVTGVAGQVIADPVVEGELSAFDEHVHHGRGDRLGRRIHAERGLRAHRHLFAARRVGGAVAACVPDGAVEHHPALVADAQLDGRMQPGPIPVAGGLPDPVERCGIQAGAVFVADGGDGVQVGGNPDAAGFAHDVRCSVAVR